MPVGPEYAADLARDLQAIYHEAESKLLAVIARKLSAGLDAPDWVNRQVDAIHQLRLDTARILRVLNSQADAAMVAALWAAYLRGTGLAGVDLAAAGVAFTAPQVVAGTAAVAFGGVQTLAMARLIDTQRKVLGQTALVIQSQAPKIYADVVQRAAAVAMAGTATRREASFKALTMWSDKGITGFTDRAGRDWAMSTYAEMTMRTTTAQAMVAGHVDQLVDAGQNLGMVSDAPEECDRCRPWEGQILALDGVMPLNPPVAVKGTLAQATAAGLFHPNCRHRMVSYIHGFTKRLTDTADPEGNKLRQKQRLYERQVRKLKQRLEIANELNPDDVKMVRQALTSKQREFKTWRDENDRKNLSYRTNIHHR